MSNHKYHTVAIVLAAGQGKRMNRKTAKQYLLLKDKPVLYYSLKAFQDSKIDDIVLVTGVGETEYVRREIVEKYDFTKVRKIIEGGKERYHSVQNGLLVVEELKKCADEKRGLSREMKDLRADTEWYVFIHDGARPFLSEEIIENAYKCVIEEKACVVGMPVKDTIKIADPSGFIDQTPDRNYVWMIQTPQTFAFSLVQEAYGQLIAKEAALLEAGVRITDDAGVIELFTDQKVKLVHGSYENIKITTPEDLVIAEALLEMK